VAWRVEECTRNVRYKIIARPLSVVVLVFALSLLCLLARHPLVLFLFFASPSLARAHCLSCPLGLFVAGGLSFLNFPFFASDADIFFLQLARTEIDVL